MGSKTLNTISDDVLSHLLEFELSTQICLVSQRWSRLRHLRHVCITKSVPSEEAFGTFAKNGVRVAEVDMADWSSSEFLTLLSGLRRCTSLVELRIVNLATRELTEEVCVALGATISDTKIADFSLIMLMYPSLSIFTTLEKVLGECKNLKKVQIGIACSGMDEAPEHQ